MRDNGKAKLFKLGELAALPARGLGIAGFLLAF
jgi:hypothetical protein